MTKDLFDAIKDEVKQIHDEERTEGFHTKLYMVAQECCHGLSVSELSCLRDVCNEIIEDRRI